MILKPLSPHFAAWLTTKGASIVNSSLSSIQISALSYDSHVLFGNLGSNSFELSVPSYERSKFQLDGMTIFISLKYALFLFY